MNAFRIQAPAIVIAATAIAPWLTAAEPQPVATSQSNAIVRENRQPGSTDWQLTRVRPDDGDYRCRAIEGYCSRQSVAAGESIDLCISADPALSFRIEIFRMGYYGGRGARLMTTLGPFDGRPQTTPEPGEKDLHECRWPATTTLTIPGDWLSGVYLGRLTTLPNDVGHAASVPDRPSAPNCPADPASAPGGQDATLDDSSSSGEPPHAGSVRHELPYWQSYVVFIVRDDRPADVLFQCSDNTWQAYNPWPGHYSLYTHPRDNQGPWAQVSFDRPYSREAQFNSVVNDPLTFGSGEFLPLEFPLAYWLEQHGYDVTYCSNSDLLTPDRGLKCRAFLSVGHDEYWDIRQFRGVETLRDAGVNLLFLSGNTMCWVTPFSPSSDGRANRRIFRGGPYGGDYRFALHRERDHGPFPERGPDEGFLLGARNIEPVNGGGDWTVTRPDHWMFDGTGVKAGDRIPGLVGWEYHGDPPDIPGLEVVAAGTAWKGGRQPQQWTATIYPGPKGNFVFNASTIFWAQGLSDPPGHVLPWSHGSRPHGPDERVQRITHNLLRRAIE